MAAVTAGNIVYTPHKSESVKIPSTLFGTIYTCLCSLKFHN